MKTIYLIAYGRVQGVNYRWRVKNVADELGIKGWVMNLEDGTVKICVQADEALLKQFIERISWKEEPGPFVERIDVIKVEENQGEFKSFDIRR